MSIEYSDNTIQVHGNCGHEVAETLIGMLQEHPDSVVDLSHCEHLHTAVFQVLFCMQIKVRGAGKGGLMARHIVPMLNVLIEGEA